MLPGLTLTAETECAVSKLTSSGRQSIGAIVKDLDVAAVVPKLLAAIEDETTNKEDAYQAQTCAGWLHWVVAEYSLAVSRLPKGLGDLGSSEGVSEWTSVSILKAAYLRANCATREDNRGDALSAFNAALPALDRVWSGKPVHKQLRYWSELFLTEYCTLSSAAARQNELPPGDRESIACFRCWARYWEATGSSLAGGVGFKGSSNSVPRRAIWKEYYSSLSQVLQHNLAFTPGNLGNASHDTPARTQLCTELKRVEAGYERLLISETEFPRADEHREEVEGFVAEVIKNWTILCGRGWSEEDLGEGGRAALSRGVLQILYNAATKTYHSTTILRSLFQVHLSLAEFDLGFKAFDSYLDIIKKSKARVEKTGIAEPSLDSDATVLETMSQAIMALCLYGHVGAVEKARQLGAELEDWLSRLSKSTPTENGQTEEGGAEQQLSKTVPPQTQALAFQAIGFAHAYWSRVTHEASSRTEIQAKAIRCLRRSLASELGRSKDGRSSFAVALLLAERKEISPAIDLVRNALMSPKEQASGVEHLYGPYWHERSLVPLWHLLALLLSVRQDYTMASRACEGALEQFRDPSVLFGKQDDPRSERSADLDASAEHPRGLVDEMSDAEKEALLQVKMTQLALVELQEGPNAAVNASYELLSLFTRLFGTIPVQATPNGTHAEPPKTATTQRRGSIFGSRSQRSQAPTRQSSIVTASASDRRSTLPSRPATTAAANGPLITVTDDERRPQTTHSSVQRSESGRRNSLKKRNRSQSRGRSDSAGTTSQHDGDPFFTPTHEKSDSPAKTGRGIPREKTVSSLKSILSSNSRSTQQSEVPTEDSILPPGSLPAVQFPKATERLRHATVLVKVWTMIAGFYRRAGMFDESKAAVIEAQKLVQHLEAEAAKDPASSGMKSDTWGQPKSVDELWGDVYSEVCSPCAMNHYYLLTELQLGQLSFAKKLPFQARADFEAALTHFPDHPLATVGLSNILLDIYSEKLLPPSTTSTSEDDATQRLRKLSIASPSHSLPLGLGPVETAAAAKQASSIGAAASPFHEDDDLPEPYKAASLPLVDRLAARDRAFTLLSGITRLGTAWDNSEAWFALARAHEESGQPDKAKEVLWWCVELEEATGVREWRSLGGGGYIV